MFHYFDADPYDLSGADLEYFVDDPVDANGWTQLEPGGSGAAPGGRLLLAGGRGGLTGEGEREAGCRGHRGQRQQDGFAGAEDGLGFCRQWVHVAGAMG